MRMVKVAATQMSCTDNAEENIRKAEGLVRRAAVQGAQIILLQELFERPYFCQKEKPEFYGYASEADSDPAVLHFRKVARELGVVLPISFMRRRTTPDTTRWQ